MDLGFHLALSYRDLKHPTSRKNFASVVGQNLALILIQCHMAYLDFSLENLQQRKKRLRLHSFGPLWTISTGNQ